MTRVRVISGDGKTNLGEGELIGETTVYFWHVENGIRSLSPADERPPDELIQEMADQGYELIEYPGNPKIQLDSGKIVFGCEVWWNKIEPSDK